MTTTYTCVFTFSYFYLKNKNVHSLHRTQTVFWRDQGEGGLEVNKNLQTWATSFMNSLFVYHILGHSNGQAVCAGSLRFESRARQNFFGRRRNESCRLRGCLPVCENFSLFAKSEAVLNVSRQREEDLKGGKLI